METLAPDDAGRKIVRDLLNEAGYQEVLEVQDAFIGPGYICGRDNRRVALLHDCFWHGHDCQNGMRLPASSTDFWAQMSDHRRRRSDDVTAALNQHGWTSIVIWRCEAEDPAGLAARLYSFLKSEPN